MKLDELKQLTLKDPKPLQQVHNELASNTFTSLETACLLTTWDQHFQMNLIAAQRYMYETKYREEAVVSASVE
ncbi:hypothetical protein T4E_3508 [Trichinella pseudospiralis]|uniref:Uncharacterized protein n=1 Tax=Trichinella pseudospiralis TaxID=6337 RepID=A0A0V0XIS3_TRIPS|nr:hypothetical protein T4E_3508 [Trichinella pseudospiralis]